MTRGASMLVVGLAAAIGWMIAPSGCEQHERATVRDTKPTASEGALLSPFCLRVPPDALSRIELRRRTGAPDWQSVTLEKRGADWAISSPISFKANQVAVESILAVFGDLELTAIAEEEPRSAASHGLGPDTAVEVKAWTGERLASHFIVGYSSGDETTLQRVGDDRVLTVRGRCRRYFDKTLDELRHPLITDFDVSQVESVSYANAFGKLEVVAAPASPGRFAPRGAVIRNFDADRASKNVAVITHLYAKGFVDTPGEPASTGLFDPGTARATLVLREQHGTRSVDVWVGAQTQDGRLHVRTSESGQIYLVSAHLGSSLVPSRSQLERTDELMKELDTARARRASDDSGHIGTAGSSHAHGHPSAPPSNVPPDLMRALGDLARQQRER